MELAGGFGLSSNSSTELPSLYDWFANAPPGRIFLFSLTSLCVLVTNALGWKLMYDHFKAGTKESEACVFFPEIRKKVMYQIFWLNMLSGTAYCGLLLPKTSLFLEFLMASYEAWALLGFMRMLIDLMGGRLRMLKILQQQPPRKLFSVMPCCCLTCCDVPRTMNANIMAVCRLGANQAAVVRPMLAAINLFIQLNGGYQLWTAGPIYMLIDIFEIISKMTSVFFIFVLYGSSEDVLRKFNIGRKFVLLRLMFIPFIVQSVFISFIFLFIDYSDDEIFPKIIAVQSWSNTLICIETLPLALFFFYVYPVHEFDLELIPTKLQFEANQSHVQGSVDEQRLPLLHEQGRSAYSLLSNSKEPSAHRHMSREQFYLSMGYQSAENLQNLWNAAPRSPHLPNHPAPPAPRYHSVACQTNFDLDDQSSDSDY